jgi:hypothetical protein
MSMAGETERRGALLSELADIAALPLIHVEGKVVLSVLPEVWDGSEAPPGYEMMFGLSVHQRQDIKDRFTSHCVDGLKTILPQNRAVQTLSSAALAQPFNEIWANLRPEERRPLVLRVWWEYLFPNRELRHNVQPGDVEYLLNVAELWSSRQLVGRPLDSLDHQWLKQ